jgi:hypothetical protein
VKLICKRTHDALTLRQNFAKLSERNEVSTAAAAAAAARCYRVCVQLISHLAL